MNPVQRRLTVDVFALARDRGVIEGELPLDRLPRLALSVVRAAGALRYRIGGEIDSQGHPGAEMQLSGDLLLQCQRCSGEISYPLHRTARFRFVESDEELAAVPIVDDDVDVIVGSHSMAVAPWVEDEAILSLPVVPRHDDCQPDYVEDARPDAESDRPNPFAALAVLKAARKPG
ncbi:MAG TPA: YceD family protein [Burkholderiaceae bacterium]|nr:YceD family protein [Burkholderiaceae bacterium]